MKVNLDTDNYFKITGTIVRVNVYANGKACNVIIGVGENKISVKSFSPDVFNVLSSGVKVEVFGHIGSNCYKDKNGEMRYKDNNDLIADVIVYLDSKKETERKKLEEIYG